MEIVPVVLDGELLGLLEICGLQVSDIASSKALRFYGCRRDGKLVGVVGLESYGSVALLRSLAVSPEARNSGLGRALVHFAENMAVSEQARALYLLTTTAEPFFAKLGYHPVRREDAPAAIKATSQFSGLCPISARLMTKRPGS